MKLRNRKRFALAGTWDAATGLGTLRGYTVTKKPRGGGSVEPAFTRRSCPAADARCRRLTRAVMAVWYGLLTLDGFSSEMLERLLF